MALNKQHPAPTDLIVIFYSLLVGQVIFALVVFYLLSQQSDVEPSYLTGSEKTDMLAMSAYALAMYFISRLLENLRRKQIPALKRLKFSPFTHYRTSCIIRWAVLEGSTLFIIVISLVTQNTKLLLLAIPMMVLFYTTRPSRQQMIEWYGNF